LLGGSRLKVSTVDNLLKSQTSTASPAEPGGLLLVASNELAINKLVTKKVKYDIKDFTAFILVDDKGNDFFKQIKPRCGSCSNK
jgi:hypothetical protein